MRPVVSASSRTTWIPVLPFIPWAAAHRMWVPPIPQKSLYPGRGPGWEGVNRGLQLSCGPAELCSGHAVDTPVLALSLYMEVSAGVLPARWSHPRGIELASVTPMLILPWGKIRSLDSKGIFFISSNDAVLSRSSYRTLTIRKAFSEVLNSPCFLNYVCLLPCGILWC